MPVRTASWSSPSIREKCFMLAHCLVRTSSVEPSHMHVDRCIWNCNISLTCSCMLPDTYTVGSRLIRLSQENVCQYEYRQHGSRHIGSITLTLAIIMFSIEKVSMCRVSADHMKSSRNAGHLMVEVREVDGKCSSNWRRAVA